MITLTGSDITLRALELTDLDFLYSIENDESIWELSNTVTPYSKFVLKQYLENAHRDIYEVKQLRLVICTKENNKAIGLIDLFDFDPKNHRVGLGIVIASETDRGKGYASEAVSLVCKFAFRQLQMHQVYANISEDNKKSMQLFTKAGFVEAGRKQDWIFSEGTYKNEYLYQLIADVH
ncbi:MULTISPECIES: GNAT family N-acetyltransferase [Altibacter]|uniref:GNAT family N-acetyltransferase n=1 Tax=Altibacter TaxID=1535231 RepID=UPI00054D250C|nr:MULTISPECIES: GNAT family N-acetyltransferase [Altibacter]MCW8980363.1 GNAT family N-acetyltransferase [Altibacter sp.]MCW9036626.1 GNAT family N-acetyltransferase [Altibacter sp.]